MTYMEYAERLHNLSSEGRRKELAWQAWGEFVQARDCRRNQYRGWRALAAQHHRQGVRLLNEAYAQARTAA